MNLYDINKEVDQAFENYLNLFDDQWTLIWEESEVEEAQKKIEELQNKKDEIIEWALKKRSNHESTVDQLKKERERFDSLIEYEEKRVDNMEKLIMRLLPDIKKPTLFWTHKVSYRNSKAVVVDNQDIIPDEFIREKVTISVDKVALKEALEKWEVEGARIEERKHLIIK